MKKIDYFQVCKKNTYAGEVGEIIRGYQTYSAPFNPNDDSKTYVLNGYALGFSAKKQYLKDGIIKKITKKEACNILLNNLR